MPRMRVNLKAQFRYVLDLEEQAVEGPAELLTYGPDLCTT